jgi:hypothetical protein
MPPIIPGTPATVSKTTALWPYLLAKNASAKNLNSLTAPYAKKSEFFLHAKCVDLTSASCEFFMV